MTWPYRQGREPIADSTLTVEPPNAEVAALLRTVNGNLDSDNLRVEVLEADHFAEGAAFGVVYEEVASTTITKAVTLSAADWMPLDDPLEAEIDCTDGTLSVDLDVSLQYAGVSAAPFFVAIGIMVDDALVAATDGENLATWANGGDYASLTVQVVVPVGPGWHRVRAVARMIEETIGAAVTINVGSANLFVLNGRA